MPEPRERPSADKFKRHNRAAPPHTAEQRMKAKYLQQLKQRPQDREQSNSTNDAVDEVERSAACGGDAATIAAWKAAVKAKQAIIRQKANDTQPAQTAYADTQTPFPQCSPLSDNVPAASPDIPVERGRQAFIRQRQKSAISEKRTSAPRSPRQKPASQLVWVHPVATPAQPVRYGTQKQAQEQMCQVFITQVKIAAKHTAVLVKRTAIAISQSVKAMVASVVGVAGGGVLLVAMVVIVAIAAVANSPFGLYFAAERNAPGTVSVPEAVGQINAAFSSRLDALQGGYDGVVIQGQPADWPDVLAAFAAKTAGADDGVDVATLDANRVDKLTTVFWDMTSITTWVQAIEHDDWTEHIIHITITAKTADDMRTQYHFNRYQNTALDELLSDRAALSALAGSLTITNADVLDILDALPEDLSLERKAVVQNALSLVGKVNYFWGGKSSAIGWDSRWGTLAQVTAAGSPTTGTYRPFGLDCSGMIDWTLRNAGLHSDGNWYVGQNLTAVSASAAQPGDFALFEDESHIGIIVGRTENGKLLVCHCSSSQNNVVVTEYAATGFAEIGRPGIY